jgi:ribose-phosphate pyrophosphokinase
MQERPFKIFSGTKSAILPKKLQQLRLSTWKHAHEHFADGEFAVSYEESIRGKQVFLIQSTFLIQTI